MATGSSLNLNHSRSQSEIQGDLHKLKWRIRETRAERETEGKVARQHAIEQLRLESDLHKLRLEIESIRSNVRRTSCVEDPKTSSNYRTSIGRAEEHVREISPAVLLAEATIPVTTFSRKKREWAF
ncbi:hypothetical protein TNCV_908361 [Trichonephila clavipes]|nr:hypothetical protein TNCV_908361 [Trichonephila clavipes]